MSHSFNTTGRMRGQRPPVGAGLSSLSMRGAEPEPLQLTSPETASAPPLTTAQRACYEALGLALQEGRVFAAVTGPAGSGKTMILDAVLAERQAATLRCIRISEPKQMPLRLVQQIETVALAQADRVENQDRHVVLAIDDAHLASDELLACLSRLAAVREPNRRVPQVLLVGRPELWMRLASEETQSLARRIAIRAVLPSLQDDADPWADLEQHVSDTMSELRHRGSARPAEFDPPISPIYERFYAQGLPATVDPAGVPLDLDSIPPPTDYALFPDYSAPVAARREARVRLWLPLTCLAITVAAIAGVLTFYDWPDLLGDMPWAEEPANPVTFNIPHGANRGLPQVPDWAEVGHSDPPPAPATRAPTSPAPLPPPRPATPSTLSAPVAAPPAAPAPPPVQSAGPVPLVKSPETRAAEAESAPKQPEPAPAVAESPAPIVAPGTQIPPMIAAANLPASHRVSPPTPPPPNAAELLRRADELVRSGDIADARPLFEHAADGGNVTAMIHLAHTYDPAFLSSREGAAMADRGRARTWYARAAAAGDHAAAARVAILDRER